MSRVVAYDCVLDAVNLRQVRSTGFSPNVELIRDRAGGATAAAIVALLSANPQVTLKSGDVAGAITNLGIGSGLWIPSGTITVPFLGRALGGTFTAGAAHETLSAQRALVVPKSFAASHNDQAGATVEIMAQLLSIDGFTAPVATNTNQTLAASAFGALYRMGPVILNSAQLSGVTQVSVTTGLDVDTDSYDGEPYPRDAYLKTAIDPTISITFENYTALAAHGPLFAALTSAVCYFRKVADGGVTVSDATAVHCAFTATGGLSINQDASAEVQKSGSATIVLNPKTLAASATSAITIP
jgi:hypothetical protein